MIELNFEYKQVKQGSITRSDLDWEGVGKDIGGYKITKKRPKYFGEVEGILAGGNQSDRVTPRTDSEDEDFG